MSHFTFVLAPVMHHVRLHFMPGPHVIRDMIHLHLMPVHLLHLAVATMIPSSRGHSRAYFACKSMTQEVNENRRDIIKIKSHLGLPYDPYHELPDFDDPFAEWDAADEAAVAAAHAPLPCPRRPSATRSLHSPPCG
ncbi:actin-like protein ARP8 [Panicum miliaceum]|uniref:Actin-like protein ARP8 n=1 Tax=Panicum miliaceum TaxID=4540 RepID=A0A3L6QC94_PANMI|nr:actin-like protein ARP8 [Panicum miliaceum]